MKSITVLIIICFKATILTKTIKNNFAEDGIDETYGLLRRNTGCSAEQKTPEANSRSKLSNSIPNRSEYNVQNSIPWNKKRSKLLEFSSKPFRQKRKEVGISFHGTKLKANFRIFVPKRFAGENFKKDNF
jgi:hypothetical protein